MIFDRNHGLESTGVEPKRAMVLLPLHAVVYAGLAVIFWPQPMVALVLAVLLVGISVADIQRFEIPDSFSALLVATGVVQLVLTGANRLDHAVAFFAFPTVLYLVGVVYLRMRGQPGLGLGDVKLAAGLGLWLGVQGSVWTLLAASLSGIATLLAIHSLRRRSAEDLIGSGVAFGPFLCLSAWAIWLQGNAA